jgi:hypothetical protein
MSSVHPRVVDQSASPRALRPVATGDRQFDEGWLQQLLFDHPDLLPITDIDPGFGKLIPLARELPVTSGYIDVLYATAEGSLCLVETKLWRNREAHRTVLAQLLDYAKDISRMNYTEFQARINSVAGRNGQPRNLDGIMTPALSAKGLSSIDFEANLRQSLASGNFLLLIVGDRIHPEVALLSDILGTAPNLEFTLALIEMSFYRLNDKEEWPVLAVPSVVGRSHEVTRAVVRIRYEEKRPEVEVTSTDDTQTEPGILTPEMFLKLLPSGLENIYRPYLERWTTGTYTISWTKAQFNLRYAPEGKLRTLFEASPTYLCITADKWVEFNRLPADAYRTYREELADIQVVQRAFNRGGRYIYYRDLTEAEVRQILEATNRLAEAWVKSGRA